MLCTLKTKYILLLLIHMRGCADSQKLQARAWLPVVCEVGEVSRGAFGES